MKKRIILITLLIVLAMLFGGLYYFAHNILPGMAKEKIIAGITDATLSNVTLDNVSFGFFKGLIITGLDVFDKDNPREKLLSIKEANANILFLPFFNKKIIISSLNIHSMQANLTRNPDNSFNISYIIEKFQNKNSDGGQKFQVIVKSVSISDSSIVFQDSTADPPAIIVLNIKDGSAGLLWNKISFRTTSKIVKNDKATSIFLKGSYNIISKETKIDISTSDIDLIDYKDYFKNIPFELKNARIAKTKSALSLKDNVLAADITLETYPASLKYNNINANDLKINAELNAIIPIEMPADVSYKGKLSFDMVFDAPYEDLNIKGVIQNSSCEFSKENKDLNFSLNLNASQISIQKDNIKSTIPSLEGTIKGLYRPAEGDNEAKISYESEVSVKDASVSGIKAIENITSVNGTISLKNNSLFPKDAEAEIKKIDAVVFNTPLTANGALKDQKLKIDCFGTFEVSKLINIAPSRIDLSEYKTSGSADINLSLVYDLLSAEIEELNGKTTINNFELQSAKPFLNFKTAKLDLAFDKSEELVRWNCDSLFFMSDTFKISGWLRGFKTQNIQTKISGKDGQIDLEAVNENGIINIKNLKTIYKNSQANITGRLDIKNKFDVNADITLYLDDLKTALGSKAPSFLGEITSQNAFAITAQVKGPIKDYRLWSASIDTENKSLKAYGLKFNDVLINYRQAEKTGFINNASFNFYGGKGAIKGRLDLSRQKITYSLQGLLNDIDLNKLKMDTKMKDSVFFGTLNAAISVLGTADDLKGLKGEGSFVIKEGNIWAFNPLKGLGNFLFIPRFSQITFSNAQGDFYIANEKVSTDNLELLSSELGLIAEGSITFDGKLDFLINTQVLKPGLNEAQKETGPQAKIGEAISQAGSLSAIKVTGTVKEPKYKLQPIAENIMKRFNDVVGGVLSNIFQ